MRNKETCKKLFERNKMEDIAEYSSANGPHNEVRDSLKKLWSWREESQSKFSYISINIEKGINDLIEEVCALQVELTVTKKTRG